MRHVSGRLNRHRAAGRWRGETPFWIPRYLRSPRV